MNKPKKSHFGASHPMTGAQDTSIKLQEDTEEVCQVCDGAEGSPFNYSVVTESAGAAFLVCANCGDEKRVRSEDVKRKKKA